jgi:hypothetical protein
MIKNKNKMRRLLYLTFISLIVSCTIFSCKDKKNEAIETITKLKGRIIIIPNDTIFRKINQTRITSFAIVEYIDSASCISCRFNMGRWEDLIKHYKSIKPDMKYLFILKTKPTKNIIYAMRWDHFVHPVVFDSKGLFEKVNNLPKGYEYHAFLIDRKYRIVAVGSPIDNQKIDDLYRQIITE